MLLGILRVSSPRLRRPQVETRPPEPLRDSGRLDAATDQNRATRRQPLPPCWSPVRATPAPPSPARLSAPGSIAPYDMIVLPFATQIKHKSRTPIHDGPLKAEVTFCVQGVLSPLLSNIYLHYVFDLWAERWRRREATGDMIMVRYADDTVVGFQHESDARRFRDAMRDRLREFSLSLHPEKTRLIEFGRFAAQNCKRRGRSKPETFKFLGFVLICDKSRRGDFRIRRKSRRDRMHAKLREINEALRRRMHRPIPETGKWLAQIVAGYFAYHAVPTNSPALSA